MTPSAGGGASVVHVNSEVKVHGVWLRDHCQCDVCVDAGTNQRNVQSAHIPLHITPMEVNVSGDGHLKVVWPGDPPHVSFYSPDFLSKYAHPGGGAQSADVALQTHSRVLFDATTFNDDGADGQGLPRVQHDAFMTDEATLYDALCKVG